MIRIFSVLIFAFACSLAQSAFAGGYYGINYAQIDQDDRFFGGDTFSTGEVYGRLGGHINHYVAGEMRLGTTVTPKEDTALDTKFQNKRWYSLLARLQYPVSVFTPYLVGGYSSVKEQVSVGGTSANATFTTTSTLGAGIDLTFKRWGINLEYLQLANEDNVSRKGPSAGIFFTFE